MTSQRRQGWTRGAAGLAVLALLWVACGPPYKQPDATMYVPEALPVGGPQPWEKGTRTPTGLATASPTPPPPPTAPPATATPAPPPPTAPPPAAAAPPATEASGTMTPAELKAKILAVMREGMDQDLILAFIARQRVVPRLTVDDILDWKRSGIADDVIKAAANR